MKKKIFLAAFFCVSISMSAQNTIDQNGLQSTVITGVNASATQAKRYEVASVIYNSHHWQNSSIVTVELYQIFPRSGYEKYNIEIGYRQGTQATNPKITHLDSQGIQHNAKVSLGAPVDHTTIYSGYVNKVIPIYVDTRYYAQYKVKITHARSCVTTFTQRDQIIINEIPLGINIADFTEPILQSSENLWSQNSNDIYYNTGKVGIGTSNPNAKLQIQKTSAGQTSFLRLKNPHGATNDTADLEFSLTSASNLPTASISAIRMGAGALTDLTFNNYNAGLKERMRIDFNGNVGIGTNDPGSFRLNVSGNVYHSGKLSIGTSYNGFTANIGGTTYLTTGSVWITDNFGFANAHSTNTGLFPRSDHSISMKTNNLIAMYVKAEGDIGIGTNNPNAKLQIQKTSAGQTSFLRLKNPHGATNDTADLEFSLTSASNLPTASISAVRMGAGALTDLTFNNYNAGLKERMRIDFNGNVGIGTTNIPANYKLAIAGKVITEEVKVQLQGSWPDYVFSNDYALPTLTEVENHIKEKGHLKNIPSTQEVAKNGIFLGEMDSKLLQKIEELTLYTIAQEKKIQSLEKMESEMKEIKKQNKELKLMLQKINDLLEKQK